MKMPRALPGGRARGAVRKPANIAPAPNLSPHEKAPLRLGPQHGGGSSQGTFHEARRPACTSPAMATPKN